MKPTRSRLIDASTTVNKSDTAPSFIVEEDYSVPFKTIEDAFDRSVDKLSLVQFESSKSGASYTAMLRRILPGPPQ